MAMFKKKTKEVLERLKAEEAKPKPKVENYLSSKQKSSGQEKKESASQSIYQVRLEKIINRLNELERKMKQGNDYFTHYWDYSSYCKEFLSALGEFEKFENSFVPEQFNKRLQETKTKVQAHLNRKIPQSKSRLRDSDDLIGI